ncbi:diacylglycerol/lipid kinase family protein [Gephyromycinifex aptenodytis]|uniref:diacylglycerol/lipid kinase family protein n=1 Tax=Gephyromycinifex aptenodytis TaxID=2716227 RepID=UPI0014453668|nr:diacylglycerol kinase family protein [Gephyromycinifex aptenodytis]
MNDLSLYLGLLSCLAVAATVVGVTVTAGGPEGRPSSPAEGTGSGGGFDDEAAPPRRRLAVIVNPTKFADVAEVHAQVTQIATRHGWAPPLWMETTIEDPGTGQARRAIAEGVELVCPLGGDGTVRSVAAALIGTQTALGLLPAGTGNLLARNLGLPIDDLEDALVTALAGTDRRIDVGTLQVAHPDDTQDELKDYFFLVMAGVGFDAAVMSEANEDLKARVGWPAYIVSGLFNLNSPRFGADICLDDGPAFHRRVRSAVIGNVGKLQGGVELLPDAVADDGALDAVFIAPKGIIGWAAVAARILTKTRAGHNRVEHHQCRRIELKLGKEEPVQLDGDPVGPGGHLIFQVLPRQLTVRVP